MSKAGGWSGTASDLVEMLSAKFEDTPRAPAELWGLLYMLSKNTYKYVLHCHRKDGQLLVDIHHGRCEDCTCRVSASPTGWRQEYQDAK